MSDEIDLAEMERLLLKEQEELLALSTGARESRDAVKLDQQSVGRLSRMDAMQGQAMAQETERRRRQRLQRIDAALARLRNDEFGFCAKCDDEIDAKRLAFDPTTPFCAACASG
ncbi:MAG: TraR/DksA C4-type zinc finger protein [Alphaproteobacteria bacterium]|nr:TraR/DksA C4-type zinc finger protein [Alphaproteobacteria bacterium]